MFEFGRGGFAVFKDERDIGGFLNGIVTDVEGKVSHFADQLVFEMLEAQAEQS